MDRLLKWLTGFSLYISTSSICLLMAIANITGRTLQFNSILLVFGVIWFTYASNKLSDLEEDAINHPERVKWINRYGKLATILSFALLLASSIYSLTYSSYVILVGLFVMIVGLLYSFLRLKKIFVVKNLMVGIAWASITLVPALETEMISVQDILIYSVAAMLFFINTVIFDIKDIDGDRANNIITIPVKLGNERTRLLCSMILVMIGLFLTTIYIGFSLINTHAFIFWILVDIYLLIFNNVHDFRRHIYYGIIIDGEYIWAYGALLILRGLGF